MLLGCIADDYTGASDLANTLTQNGMRTVQYIGVPAEASPGAEIEAGVIALKSRSIEPAQAVEQSLAALRWLKRSGCSQIFFKYCSTFDSTPRGNIGPVAQALLAELDAPIAIACPAFPTNRRTVYQGHLFVGDKLLNECGMEAHPLNPMKDANLVRVLQQQCTVPVGLVDLPAVARGSESIRKQLLELSRGGVRLAIVDALNNEQLKSIGEALSDAPLVTGGSGVAMGLAENFRRQNKLSKAGPFTARVEGKAVVLSGSCSSATQKQVAAYCHDRPSFRVPVERLAEPAEVSELVSQVCGWVLEHSDGESPLVYSTAAAEEISKTQERFGKEKISRGVETFFGAVAKQLHQEGVRRFVVAGGETAGAVVNAIGVQALRIGAEIDPGVPTMTSVEAPTVAFALKSGNFGGEEFFLKALQTL